MSSANVKLSWAASAAFGDLDLQSMEPPKLHCKRNTKTDSDNKSNPPILVVEENWLSYPDYDLILECEDITRRSCANTSKLALSAT